jgi:short-subunit dehydrogenase
MQLHIARVPALRQIELVEANLILGASRGLGRELAKVILSAGEKVVGVARKGDRLAELANEFPSFSPVVADLSKPQGQSDVLTLLKEQKFARVFYCSSILFWNINH